MNNKPVENSMKNKLESALNPIHLSIINESYMHNVPKGSETHFKIVLVSDKFENMTLLQVSVKFNFVFKSSILIIKSIILLDNL